MKLDWGKTLIIVMVAFMALIVTLGIKMATSDQTLYEEEYYERGNRRWRK